MKNSILLFLSALLFIGCSNNYGKKVSRGDLEVYYKDGMTQEQAQKTLDYIASLLKGETGRKSYQIRKGNGDTVNFSMVVDEEKAKQAGDETFYALARMISENVFANAPVNLTLADKSFDPIRTLAFRKPEAPVDNTASTGGKVNSGNIEVYIDPGFNQETASAVAAWLNQNMQPQSTISFKIVIQQGNYLLQMMADKEQSKGVGDDQLMEIASGVSTNVLSNEPVVFELVDENLQPFRKVEYPKQ